MKYHHMLEEKMKEFAYKMVCNGKMQGFRKLNKN